ncbi:rRNA processing [Plasmopara halstedii]|uniref:rRNA processing n=1 Tax=Plasmopara halstedii TaxID=4781 RepID=A0A0P1A9M2_PLAHL|nr:rRNA processing [Plasmopara halstedii]CEG37429.1 rRNA processing [Plasmopara halstedii]|eukprot:XP_024573798.1 rRNA processing [Plasmopara halstedii]
MRGSGLSIQRFVKGKAQRSKSDAKSKKKLIIHKAQRRRQYEKIKKREESAPGDGAGDTGTRSSFYDQFFSKLNEEVEKVEARTDRTHRAKEEKQRVTKPDPFYKAKKKAAISKLEKQRGREERQERIATFEKKVIQRKKRHVKLSQRTAMGQPVVRNHINDILSRLQAEKKKEGN